MRLEGDTKWWTEKCLKILSLNSRDAMCDIQERGESVRYAVGRPQKFDCCVAFHFVSDETKLCRGYGPHWLYCTSTLHILFERHFRKCPINFTQIKQWSKVPWKKVSITDIWKAKSDKELNYIIHWCSGLPWDDVWATEPEKYLVLPQKKKKFSSTQLYYAKYRFVSEYGGGEGWGSPYRNHHVSLVSLTGD